VFLPLVSSITQFRVRRTSFCARYFLRNIRRADLVVPASSAVCHKKRSFNLLALRASSAPVASNSCTVTALYFPYFQSKFHLMNLLHGRNHHSIGLLHRATRTVALHKQACSPSAQTGPQSHRTNRPAVPPHRGQQSHRTNRPAVPPYKQACSPTAQIGPQSHRTNRPAVPPHKQARSPTAQTGLQSHCTNRPAVPSHKQACSPTAQKACSPTAQTFLCLQTSLSLCTPRRYVR